jgi:hypothetical protein
VARAFQFHEDLSVLARADVPDLVIDASPHFGVDDGAGSGFARLRLLSVLNELDAAVRKVHEDVVRDVLVVGRLLSGLKHHLPHADPVILEQ